jgi:hypothetical protein
LNKIGRLTTQELIADVNKSKGKAGGWPGYFTYSISGDSITISVSTKVLDKKATRRLDPWGLAFLVDAEYRCGIKVNSINFAISDEIEEIKPGKRLALNLEAFRRRVSYLGINNQNLRFGITINGKPLEIDDTSTMFNRPNCEIPHGSFDRTAQDNSPILLEKAFQTWLFANDVKAEEDKDANTNERLAVLGVDFFKLKNKAYGIIREFRTGAFYREVSNHNRILPTDFVDIVTLNKYGQLALIELKLNDSQLEVIAQLMDYALFFRCYRDKLWPIISEKLQKNPRGKDIICYVVNNYFHDRFDNVMRYYRPRNSSYGFRIKKVVLGHYSEI